MSRLSDLLEAVQAAPDDDAPRRVYADALLEAGDPLGEFIHVQCDLAAGGLSREEALKRRRRGRELLAANEKRWTAGLERLAHNLRFVRGFVDRLTLDAETWASCGEELFAAAPALRAITVTGMWVRAYDNGGEEASTRLVLSRLENALASPLLRRLEGFGHHSVGYVVPDPIWELSESIGENPHGRTVDLDAEAMELLLAADLSQLRALALSPALPKAIEALAAAPVVKQLERFELIHVEADVGPVLASLDPGRLRWLGLAQWCDEISRFPALTTLRLMSSIRPLGQLPRGLRRLECAATSENFAALSACEQLVELELSFASMEKCRELSRLPCAQRLELLRVGKVKDSEFAELQKLFACVVEMRGY